MLGRRAHAVALILVIALHALGFLACGTEPPPDEELLAHFRLHKSELQALVALLQHDRACDLVNREQQVDCMPATVTSARRLLQSIGANYLSRGNEEIVVGYSWVGIGQKGFAFREEEPKPRSLVTLTDLHPELHLGKVYYRRIEERWYIRALYDV